MTPPSIRDLFAVLLGGMIGTGARWALDVLIPHDAAGFPVSTLVINIVGSFALGSLVGGLWKRDVPSWVKAGLGAGLLGTFTTFSAVVLALVTLTEAGEILTAAVYLVVTLIGGFVAAAAGISVGAALLRGPGARRSS